MFYISNIGAKHPKCPGFLDKQSATEYINNLLSILQARPDLYEKYPRKFYYNHETDKFSSSSISRHIFMDK